MKRTLAILALQLCTAACLLGQSAGHGEPRARPERGDSGHQTPRTSPSARMLRPSCSSTAKAVVLIVLERARRSR